MKDGKKHEPRRMKHRIREEKKREQRIGLAVTVIILIVNITASGLFVNSMLGSSRQKQETSSTSEPKAAIVNQLSLTYPNQTFVQTATNTLAQAGYTTDYYPGEKVTVEFYRNLPTHGYKIVVLRTHSALVSTDKPPVTLFTSEPYSQTAYVYEQLRDQVGWVTYRFERDTPKEPTYFGISPLFVKDSMNGDFQDSVIVMMGCNGLTYTDMAKAFIERGAIAYVGWKDAVLASHTDSATAHLLQHFLIEKRSLRESVQDTFEVGCDPVNENLLTYYPLEAGGRTIEDLAREIRARTDH